MGTLLSSFQRIIGPKLFTHGVRIQKDLEVDGDIIYKGSCAKPQVVTKSPPGVNLGPLILIPEASRACQISGFSTIGSAVNTLDLSSQTPAGTKAVYLFMYMDAVGAASASMYIFTWVRKYGTLSTTGANCPEILCGVRSLAAGEWIRTTLTASVEVDSSGRLQYRDLYRDSGGVTGAFYLSLYGYYMGG